MHIAVVTRNMKGGGAERVIAQLLSKWNSWNVTCSLISMEPAEAFYSVPENVQCCDIPGRCHIPGLNKLQKYAELRKKLKNLKPDVVLAMPEDIGIYVIPAMLGTGIPVVVSERNNPWVMPYKRISRVLRRLAYPFAAGIIFQTEQAAAFFPKAQQKKGIVLDNPLDLSRLSHQWEETGSKTVISAGRLEKQKNFPLLIHAFHLLLQEHQDYRLVIYGEGSERRSLETLAADLLPEDTWSMPGSIHSLPERMICGSMFVLSSDYEGIPNVLMEAMASGMPVAATDCAPGGAAALIENGVNGLLVPVKDEKALAHAMAFLADYPLEAQKMGKKAMELRSRLDADQVCARWLEYLKQCM